MSTRLIAPLALLVCLTACGQRDAGEDAVAWIESAFRDGSIKQSLSTGERIALSRTEGFRRRGPHILEAVGLQYRLVRVEAIVVSASDLTVTTETSPRRLVPDELFNRVESASITRVAEISLEIVPDKAWLQDNAVEMVVAGDGASITPFTDSFHLLHDGTTWSIARGTTQTDARRLLAVYRGTESLQTRILTRELAPRLISQAPEQPAG